DCAPDDVQSTANKLRRVVVNRDACHDGRGRHSGSGSYPVLDNTPVERTAIGPDLVEVIDPSHPLFGLRLPLLRVELRERLGRVCIVSIAPGLERLIPVAATNLGGCLYPTSPCRLSIAAIQQLLAVAAAVAQWTEEDAH